MSSCVHVCRATLSGAAAAALTSPLSGYSLRMGALAAGTFGLIGPVFAMLSLLVQPGLQGPPAAMDQPMLVHMTAAGVAGGAMYMAFGVLWPLARQAQQRVASFAMACGLVCAMLVLFWVLF